LEEEPEGCDILEGMPTGGTSDGSFCRGEKEPPLDLGIEEEHSCS
jgi:hypothetical protein